MADVVLGLTKSAVKGTLSRVQSAIEEGKLKVRVQQDLVFITGEFQIMLSFLNVANAERAKNEVVRSWVRQLRDLAYDVEDCVEFIVQLDKKSVWWWRVVPSCMAPMLPLVAELNQLKGRVEEVSHRNMRYNLISDSGSKPIPCSASFDVLSEAMEATKKQGGLGDLTELITKEDSDLQVISVWGTGGDHGITSTVNKAYEDPEICQKFTSRAWAKLMHPFNCNEFLQCLLSQFYANSHEVLQGANVAVDVLMRMKAATTTEETLVEEVMHQVNKQRYLVVLEDLSAVVEWHAIRMYLPDSKNGSRIIVLTQQLEIASLCIGQPHRVSELRKFSAGHSVYAFFKECSQYDGDEREEAIDEISTEKHVSYLQYSQHNGNKCEEAINEILTENEAIVDTIFTIKRKEANAWFSLFKLVGRQEEVKTIYDHICQGGPMTSVWGVAGVGKSDLVRYVYYMHVSQENMEMTRRRYSWVNVPNPFNLTEFCRGLLLDFHSEFLQAKETATIRMMSSKDLIEECCKLLRRTLSLVVIDGLQFKEEWDLINATLFSEPTKAYIVVITNEANVATYCVYDPTRSVFNIKCLEDDAALDLLKQVSGINGSETDGLTANEKIIVTKCGGLPKVIVEVGKYLSYARHIGEWTKASMDMSVRFMGELETNPQFDNLKDLFAWMQSYFDACPDSLKPCIFYLPVFPTNHSIRRRRLGRRLIAEGYSRDMDDNTAEENAEKFFSKIVDLSMIQQLPQAGKGMINGFFREYIISQPMEDNLVIALEGRCSLNSKRAGQHLTIGSSWDRDINVFQGIDFSRLRSLTVFGKWERFFISANMRLLQVLDLEDTLDLSNDDLEKIGKLPPFLKFISLRGCTKINRLPSSFGGLRQLQTLDVRHTSIVTLPSAIIKLQKLQYIRAGKAVVPLDDAEGTVSSIPPATSEDWTSTPSRNRLLILASRLFVFRRGQLVGGVNVPLRIGKLTNLHTLGVVNVNVAGAKAILKELKKLTQLRKLGVSGINQENSKGFCSAISGHGHLESLSVRLDKDKQDFFCCLDEIFEPPKTLKSLKLHGHIEKFPIWIKQLGNLKKLDLEITILMQEDIHVLADLPCLDNLRLRLKPIQYGELNFCCSREAGLQRRPLRLVSHVALEISCSSRLWVHFGEWIVGSVVLLKFHCSSGSTLRISGLWNVRLLKEVVLTGSYDDELKQNVLGQIDRFHVKPVLRL